MRMPFGVSPPPPTSDTGHARAPGALRVDVLERLARERMDPLEQKPSVGVSDGARASADALDRPHRREPIDALAHPHLALEPRSTGPRAGELLHLGHGRGHPGELDALVPERVHEHLDPA